ncbi:hypothetical protein [Streptomyces lavendofoliae]|uniref:hypothetical protein n=1 Tax=Streptomyces lavendofoliae TaxID=67314 RepID=UPI00300F4B76
MSLSTVVLACGRHAELREVRMSSTYGGFLEGYPCGPVNDMVIRRLLSSAEGAFGANAPVHLVPPAVDRPEGAAGGFGPVEVLPPVACVGAFRSSAVTAGHDPVAYRSVLAVVWFQSTTDVPSGSAADPGLRGIVWAALARDEEL